MKAIRLVTLLTAFVLGGCGDGSVQSPDFTPQLQTLEVTPATGSVADGQTFEFSAMGTFSVPPGSNDAGEVRDISSDVRWESSNTAVATIDDEGVATGVSPGTVTITASKDGITDEAALTVGPGVLEDLVILPANPTVAIGLTQELTARGIFSDDRANPRDLPPGTVVNWTSSNTAVASVTTPANPTIVTGMSNGTSTITATTTIGGTVFDGTTIVTVGGVAIPVGGLVRVEPATAFVAPGETQEFVAIGNFGGANEMPVDDSLIDWTSSDATVGTILPTGVATGVAQGTTTITATIKQSVTGVTGDRDATATLTVTDGICTTPLIGDGAIATPVSVGLVNVGNAVANPGFVTDTQPETFAGVSTVAGVTGGVGVRVIATAPSYSVPFAGGQSPGFVIGRSPADLIGLDLFQQVQVSTLLNGAVQETTGPTDALRLGLFGFQLVGVTEPLSLVTIPATLPYDGLQIILRSRVAGVLPDLQVFSACATTRPPQPVPAATIASVALGTNSLEVGATTEAASFGDAAGEQQIADDVLTWSSGDPLVATVDQFGVVKATGVGATTIRAMLKSGGATVSSSTLTVTASLCEARFLAPDYETTSEVSGPVCTGANSCRASNVVNVTDEPKINFADIDIVAGVGLLGDGVAVTVAPRSGATVMPVLPGDQPGFVIGREPNAPALVGLLGQFTIETLLGGEVQETAGSLSPLDLDLLGMTLVGNSQANVLRFASPTTKEYDGLRLRVSPIVGLLLNVRVFSACATTP